VFYGEKTIQKTEFVSYYENINPKNVFVLEMSVWKRLNILQMIFILWS